MRVKQGEYDSGCQNMILAEVGDPSLREIGIFMAFKSWDGMKSQESSLGNLNSKEKKGQQNEASLEMN